MSLKALFGDIIGNLLLLLTMQLRSMFVVYIMITFKHSVCQVNLWHNVGFTPSNPIKGRIGYVVGKTRLRLILLLFAIYGSYSVQNKCTVFTLSL